MTTYIHHDAQGNIKGAVVFDASGKSGIMLTPRPGVFTAKIEGLKFKSERPSHQELSVLIKNFKVDPSNPTNLIERVRK